jgi:hypothetical protein
LISADDDGIVVERRFDMTRVPVGLALRDRLGDNGVRDLEDHLEQHRETWRVDVVNAVSERLDGRLKECAKRDDIARMEKQMADAKVEMLRWSFVFWIGQVATIAVLLSYMLAPLMNRLVR